MMITLEGSTADSLQVLMEKALNAAARNGLAEAINRGDNPDSKVVQLFRACT
jgi:hypothetical protein